VANTLDKLH